MGVSRGKKNAETKCKTIRFRVQCGVSWDNAGNQWYQTRRQTFRRSQIFVISQIKPSICDITNRPLICDITNQQKPSRKLKSFTSLLLKQTYSLLFTMMMTKPIHNVSMVWVAVITLVSSKTKLYETLSVTVKLSLHPAVHLNYDQFISENKNFQNMISALRDPKHFGS